MNAMTEPLSRQMGIINRFLNLSMTLPSSRCTTTPARTSRCCEKP